MKLKKLTSVDRLVVHCSATPPTMDIGAKEIDQWHRKRGWLKIGYHNVIRRNGTLEIGRAIDEVGSHAIGYNSSSLAVCLVGGVDADMKPQNNFTPAQMATLSMLLKHWKRLHPKAEVVGHNDLTTAKACPSFNAKAWWATQ